MVLTFDFAFTKASLLFFILHICCTLVLQYRQYDSIRCDAVLGPGSHQEYRRKTFGIGVIITVLRYSFNVHKTHGRLTQQEFSGSDSPLKRFLPCPFTDLRISFGHPLISMRLVFSGVPGTCDACIICRCRNAKKITLECCILQLCLSC